MGRRDDLERLAQAEDPLQVLPHRLGRRRGQRHHRGPAVALEQRPDAQVGGPEVVSPLRGAMRLVDREERDAALEQRHEQLVARQGLGRGHHEQLAALGDLLERRLPRLAAHGPVEAHDVDPARLHVPDLILDQRQERRDHDDGLRQEQRRNLEAGRLPVARRQDDEPVAPVEGVADDLFLLGVERRHPEEAGGLLDRLGGPIRNRRQDGFLGCGRLVLLGALALVRALDAPTPGSTRPARSPPRRTIVPLVLGRSIGAGRDARSRRFVEVFVEIEDAEHLVPVVRIARDADVVFVFVVFVLVVFVFVLVEVVVVVLLGQDADRRVIVIVVEQREDLRRGHARLRLAVLREEGVGGGLQIVRRVLVGLARRVDRRSALRRDGGGSAGLVLDVRRGGARSRSLARSGLLPGRLLLRGLLLGRLLPGRLLCGLLLGGRLLRSRLAGRALLGGGLLAGRCGLRGTGSQCSRSSLPGPVAALTARWPGIQSGRGGASGTLADDRGRIVEARPRSHGASNRREPRAAADAESGPRKRGLPMRRV